jgi:transcriptional regulator with XRE-family HTH domain
MSIGRFLQDKRIQNNMSVEEVADKSKVSGGTVRAYEQGRRQPSVKALMALLEALEVTESTWIDTLTWKNPVDDVIYDLAPSRGGWSKNRKTSNYDPSVNLAKIRLEAIEAILLADKTTLMAVITLIKR